MPSELLQLSALFRLRLLLPRLLLDRFSSPCFDFDRSLEVRRSSPLRELVDLFRLPRLEVVRSKEPRPELDFIKEGISSSSSKLPRLDVRFKSRLLLPRLLELLRNSPRFEVDLSLEVLSRPPLRELAERFKSPRLLPDLLDRSFIRLSDRLLSLRETPRSSGAPSSELRRLDFDRDIDLSGTKSSDDALVAAELLFERETPRSGASLIFRLEGTILSWPDDFDLDTDREGASASGMVLMVLVLDR